MPIYEFRCEECLEKDEHYLSMEDRNKSQVCECGGSEHRLISIPGIAVSPLTGRDKVLGALNKEEGYSLPGENNKHDPRYIPALARGLDPPKRSPQIQGFGEGARKHDKEKVTA